QLVSRWEPHQMPVYLLKRQRGSRALGRGVRPPSPGCEQAVKPPDATFCEGAFGWMGSGWGYVRRGSVSTLARAIEDEVEREVLDQTELKGIYDIDVKYSPKSDSPFPTNADAAARPDIFTAVREQLGFELVPATTERTVQWIERVERPTLD